MTNVSDRTCDSRNRFITKPKSSAIQKQFYLINFEVLYDQDKYPPSKLKHILVFAITLSKANIHHSHEHSFKTELISNELNFPWGIAFLPSGEILITEKNPRNCVS